MHGLGIEHGSNMAVNYTATTTANWASMKHKYTEEGLERMRPWLAWIPMENTKKTLENTTHIATTVSNYSMIRSRNDRHSVNKRVSFPPVFSCEEISADRQNKRLRKIRVSQDERSPENCDTGQRFDVGEIEDSHIRRSNRKVRQPSRFASAVMIGLWIAKLFHTDPTLRYVIPTQRITTISGNHVGKRCDIVQVFSRDQNFSI
jgi:hypothetical protein